MSNSSKLKERVQEVLVNVSERNSDYQKLKASRYYGREHRETSCKVDTGIKILPGQELWRSCVSLPLYWWKLFLLLLMPRRAYLLQIVATSGNRSYNDHRSRLSTERVRAGITQHQSFVSRCWILFNKIEKAGKAGSTLLKLASCR